MRIQKKFMFEKDGKLVLDIILDELPEVLTKEEVKEKFELVVRDARRIIAELMTDVKFETIDLERQTFLIALEGKTVAIASQFTATDAEKFKVIDVLEKQGFVEAD